MVNIKTEYCLHCFAPIDNSVVICPNCKNNVQLQNPNYAVTTNTLLQNRYIVGKILRENDLTILYVGLDTVDHTRVYIEEFYPKPLVTRELITNNVVTSSQNSILFKTMHSDILDRWNSLSKMDSTHLPVNKEIILANQTTYRITHHHSFVTLTNYVKNKGPMDWMQCKNSFLPLCNMLSKLHAQGFSHCGISPDNIIMTTRGQLLLIGFSLPELRTMGSVLTPALYTGYSAPEQYAKNEWQGEWTDVYSVACVMYYVLTGIQPPDSTQRLVKDTLAPLSNKLKNLPSEACEAITDALNPHKDARTSDINQLVAAILLEKSANTAVFAPEPSMVNITPTSSGGTTKSAKKSVAKTDSKLKAKNIIAILASVATLSIIVNVILLVNIPASTPPTEESSAVDELDEQLAEITTPLPYDLQGVYLSKAQTLVKNLPSHIAIVYEYDYNEEYPLDVVVSQSDPVGTIMEDMLQLTLLVSRGSQYVIMPQIVGSSETLATQLLTEIGVKFSIVYEEQPNGDDAVGTVIDVDKRYREQLDKETSRVIFTVKVPTTIVAEPEPELEIELEEQQESDTE